MRRIPYYTVPIDWKCPNCGEPDGPVPCLNDWDDEFGTVYPENWGKPVCAHCGQPIEGLKEDYPQSF